MNKLTKQEVIKTIELVNSRDPEILQKYAKDFLENLNELIFNVTEEEKQTIIEFFRSIIINWNDISLENQEYGNLLYRNITTDNDKTIIEIYEPDIDDSIKKIITLTLLDEITTI